MGEIKDFLKAQPQKRLDDEYLEQSQPFTLSTPPVLTAQVNVSK